MIYRVWDLDSGNIIVDCDTEWDAWASVRRTVDHYGEHAVDSWALEQEDEDGNITLVAKGEELIGYARGDRVSGV